MADGEGAAALAEQTALSLRGSTTEGGANALEEAPTEAAAAWRGAGGETANFEATAVTGEDLGLGRWDAFEGVMGTCAIEGRGGIGGVNGGGATAKEREGAGADAALAADSCGGVDEGEELAVASGDELSRGAAAAAGAAAEAVGDTGKVTATLLPTEWAEVWGTSKLANEMRSGRP